VLLVKTKIADSRDDLRRFDSPGNNPTFSPTVNLRMPVSQKEVSPLSSHQTTECSNSKSKTELGDLRVKSFLPVPRSQVTGVPRTPKEAAAAVIQGKDNGQKLDDELPTDFH